LTSSTSSSERPGGGPVPGWRLWVRLLGPTTIFVAIVLLLVEILSRTALVRASKDLRRFRGYPHAALELQEAPALRLALVGNSATDRGVDPAILAGGMTARLGRPVQAGKFVADASRVNDWYFMLNRFFWQPGLKVDLFVITFYEDDLEDGNRIELGRLAQFFARPQDWPTVFDVDVPGLGDRIDFLISSGWMAFAVRSRIRDRFLGVNANLDDFLTQVNAENRKHGKKQRRPVGQPAPAAHTYRALDRLLAAAAASGARLLFVAYPAAPPPVNPRYEVPAATRDRLRAAGAGFLDMRDRVPRIQARHYEDDVHLSPEGAALYSQALAQALAELSPRGP
jgi:hypothetical protein